MKTYEEKTQNVFKKIKEAEVIQKKRNNTIKRIVAPVLSFCIVAVCGFGIWKSGVFMNAPMISAPDESDAHISDVTTAQGEKKDTILQSENADNNAKQQDQQSGKADNNANQQDQQSEKADDNNSGQQIVPSGDEVHSASVPSTNSGASDSSIANKTNQSNISGISGESSQEGKKVQDDQYVPTGKDEENDVCKGDKLTLTDWGNKNVPTEMADVLTRAPSDKVFEIIARPYIDYDFVHDGKTLNEYYCDMCDERTLPEVLAQLIKEGDSLKYGTALYEGGAPNGEKWYKSLYDERIEFYGTEILDKYIVNGEFLRSQAESDLEAAKKAKEATKAYKAAFAAYYKYLVDTLQISIPANVKGSDGIIMHMTAENFRTFTADHIEAWNFSLADSETFAHDE